MPQDIGQLLVNLANSCIQHSDGNPETIRNSLPFDHFLRAIGEIQRLELKAIPRTEKIEFLLNVYQVMLFHQIIDEPQVSRGWFSSSRDDFIYCIGSYNYTLRELKHGVLRGNSKPPDSYQRVFSAGDPRLVLPGYSDPRILIICVDPPAALRPLQCFRDNYEEVVQRAFEQYCNVEVCVNMATEELVLPKVFQTYQSDFGSQQEVIRAIWPCLKLTEMTVDEVLKMIEQQRIYLHYRE